MSETMSKKHLAERLMYPLPNGWQDDEHVLALRDIWPEVIATNRELIDKEIKAAIEQRDQIIAGLATAVSNLNSALNELWGRDDCTTFAQLIGAPMLDRIMNAQNAAFFLASEAASKARAALSSLPSPAIERSEA